MKLSVLMMKKCMIQLFNEVWPRAHTATNKVNPMSGCGKE